MPTSNPGLLTWRACTLLIELDLCCPHILLVCLFVYLFKYLFGGIELGGCSGIGAWGSSRAVLKSTMFSARDLYSGWQDARPTPYNSCAISSALVCLFL